MRLDQVELAIRQRSLLECLDLAFLFCRHHFFGLSAAGLIGALPFYFLNAALFANPSGPTIDSFGVYLILVMEVPWAMLPVTIYMGHVTFSRRPSVRRMFLDAIAAIPSMLVFQVLVRGICCAIVIVAPMSFFGMYYMNEIILLEKTPMSKAWNRRTAMNSRSLARIITFRLFDAGILCVGTWLLVVMFNSVTSLWNDEPFGLMSIFEDRSTLLQLIHFGEWQTELSYWSILVFLTVFRFIGYLDGRIRREGWDVQLKLRSESTKFARKERFA